MPKCLAHVPSKLIVEIDHVLSLVAEDFGISTDVYGAGVYATHHWHTDGKAFGPNAGYLGLAPNSGEARKIAPTSLVDIGIYGQYLLKDTCLLILD